MRLIRPATSLRDAMVMRRVRNECRSFMTHNQNEISYFGQLWWWLFLDHEKYKPYVVGEDFGYALIFVQSPKAWLTAGLVENHRGRGLGFRVFQELIDNAISLGLEPWLEVRKDNHGARRVYDKLGFVIVNEHDDVVVMRR